MENKKIFVAFDLDDTLYKEIDFLRSAYREIALKVEAETNLSNVYENMMQDYYGGNDVFQNLVNQMSGLITKDMLLEIYRNHIPDISLNHDAKACLESLYKAGIPMGIITDGRSLTQRNKMKALGLEKWISKDNWIISEEIGTEKPNQNNYMILEHKYPDYHYIYVGNNPKKDFKGANELGWITVCLLDSGEEIHPQNFQMEEFYLPQIKIVSLIDIKSLIDKKNAYER